VKVMMLILERPEEFAARAPGPAAEAYWQQWKDYSSAVGAKVIGGNVLDGVDKAATIRIRDGRRQIQDGPFADSKEALGGVMIFEVETFAEAVELASACPAAATGAVELRPIVEMEPMA